MNRLPFIFALLINGITTGSAQSMLKVRLADNSRLNVEVDGRYFNKTGTSVTVGELPAGLHNFKIYTLEPNRRGKMRQVAIYSGRVATHRGYISVFTYEAMSRATDIQEQDINSYSQINPAIPRMDNENQYQGSPSTQVNNNNNDPGNDNKYIEPSSPVASPAPAESMGTLTEAKTSELKTKVAAKKTDTEKMNVLKDGLKNEQIITSQVGMMMDWFNFESSKVDFATWAYASTVDKENFGTLDTKLSYKNYEEELAKFLKDNGQ